jgi:hypothetical protein
MWSRFFELLGLKKLTKNWGRIFELFDFKNSKKILKKMKAIF